jgi:hypothetical protein
MSWSVTVTAAKGDDLKTKLNAAFDQAEATVSWIPEEVEVVKKCRDLTLAMADLNPAGMGVSGYGSVYVESTGSARTVKSALTSLSITPCIVE